MRRVIRENRVEIDACIKRKCSSVKLNDRERELWIMNDEGLYRWYQSELQRRKKGG
mgnify:CR=1 FL=1